MDAALLQPQSFEEQIYCAAIDPGDVCFDVGANRGEVSLLLSSLAGADGHVVAFEPVWPVYVSLCEQVQTRPVAGAPITTVPVGLADEVREATIQVPTDDFPMGSLAKAEVWADVLPRREITSFHCQLTTLDRFLDASLLAAPDFMKVDVEGAEVFVLRGAGKFFHTGHRPLLLVEVFAPWERAFDYGPWAVLSLLQGLGYRFLFACPSGLVEHRSSASQPFPAAYVGGYNVVAYQPDTHADRLGRLRLLQAGGSTDILPMPSAPVPNRP